MKKLPSIIKNELKELKKLEAHHEWKEETRKSLLLELGLNESVSAGKQSIFQTIKALSKDTLRQLSLKPVGIFIIILGVIIGPGIATVSAARLSLPGDALYSLKRGLETVQISLTFSEKKKAEKKIEHVANRLDELQRITHEQTPSIERDENIVLVLAGLKEDTEEVKLHLETAAEEGSEVIEIALIIEEKTSEYKETLRASVDQLSEEVADDVEDIELALSTVQGIAIDAINIIAEDHEEGSEEVSTEDIKKLVQEQLDDVKEQVETLSSRISELRGIESEFAVDEEPVDGDEEAENPDAVDEETSVESESADQTEEDAESTDSEPNDPENTEEESLEEVTEELSGDVSQSLSDLQDQLSGLINEQLQFVDELIGLEEYSTALDRLSETKETIDELALQLRNTKDVIEEVAEETPEQVVEDEVSEDTPAEEENPENTEEVAAEEVNPDTDEAVEPVE